MVGIPRSRGCVTCRRRKVKCDEEKPLCQRCQRAGFACEGYTVPLRFVDQTAVASRSRPKKSLSESPTKDERERQAIVIVSKSPSPLSADTYVGFAIQNLYGHGADEPTVDFKAWVLSIAEDAEQSNVARTSLDCFATTYFGKINCRPDIVAQGNHLYGKALRQLKSAIEDPNTAFSPRNIAATIAVSQYETLVYTSAHGWVQHAGGTGRLMEMRGPALHQEGDSHNYFLLSRFGIINQAAVSRKKTFLASPEWRHVPWAKDPESKTSCDKILDVFADIPGVFEEFDRLSLVAGVLPASRKSNKNPYTFWNVSGRAEGPEQDSWERLRERIIVQCKAAEAWRKEWEMSRRTVMTLRHIDPAQSLTWDTKLQYPGPLVFDYPDIAKAFEVVVFFITLASLGAIGAQLRNPGMLVNEVHEPVPPPFQSEMERVDKLMPSLPTLLMPGPSWADWAVRSLDYMLEERHRGSSLVAALMLLRICFMNSLYMNRPWHTRWAVQTFRRIGDATTFDLSHHMDGLKLLGIDRDVGTAHHVDILQRAQAPSPG